ncbi:MAG: thiamine-phosphate kinase [Candidatus Latescibacteria bacterium]|jgi:thiamine-monophosphate kinase|nr:thiamine-phosphate kinase [Candidatus Latescibacterota bacterium]
MATIRDIGEFGFINRIAEKGLTREEDVVCGIGDDCAVLPLDAHRVLLLTTDLMVEDVHFRLGATSPQDLGYKLLAVNLSDVAAMGGDPREAVVSVAAPTDLDLAHLDGLYDGLHECAERFRTNIVGGDTTRSPGPLVLNLALTGEASSDCVLTRSGARPGDLVYASGTLGDSAGGLALVLGEEAQIHRAAREHLLRRHHRPEPRVELGKRLAASGAVTAMIDLSDGVASDLQHICERSEVSAVVEEARVPLSPPLRGFCRSTGTDPMAPALSGGEDYELLFTADPGRADKLDRIAAATDVPPLHRIGEIGEGPANVCLISSTGERRELSATGFDHFGSDQQQGID